MHKRHKSTVFVKSILFTMDTTDTVFAIDGSFEVEQLEFLQFSTPERISSSTRLTENRKFHIY